MAIVAVLQAAPPVALPVEVAVLPAVVVPLVAVPPAVVAPVVVPPAVVEAVEVAEAPPVDSESPALAVEM